MGGGRGRRAISRVPPLLIVRKNGLRGIGGSDRQRRGLGDQDPSPFIKSVRTSLGKKVSMDKNYEKW